MSRRLNRSGKLVKVRPSDLPQERNRSRSTAIKAQTDTVLNAISEASVAAGVVHGTHGKSATNEMVPVRYYFGISTERSAIDDFKTWGLWYFGQLNPPDKE